MSSAFDSIGLIFEVQCFAMLENLIEQRLVLVNTIQIYITYSWHLPYKPIHKIMMDVIMPTYHQKICCTNNRKKEQQETGRKDCA